MSARAWRSLVRAIVVAAPVLYFFFLLVTSPTVEPGFLLAIGPVFEPGRELGPGAAAGTFAGLVLGRILDPPVLIGVILAGFAGISRRHFTWAPGIGIMVGAAGCLLGYRFRAEVSGSAAATQWAVSYVVWAVLLSSYGYIAGQVLIEACERLAKPALSSGAQVYPRRDTGGADDSARDNSSVLSSAAAAGRREPADYYSLISRAVARLSEGTKESRADLYERARAAQLNELRNRNPPMGNSELERELLALENAIRTIEIDMAIKRALAPKADRPREVERSSKPRDDPSPINILLEELGRAWHELKDLRKGAPALYINFVLFAVFGGPPLVIYFFIGLMDGEIKLHHLLNEVLRILEQLTLGAFSLLFFIFCVAVATRTWKRLKVRR